MVQIKILIRNIRQESRIAQFFTIAAFLSVCLTGLVTRLQGHATSPNDLPSFFFLMMLGFLACAHSRLTLRIAQVAETLADIQTKAATSGPHND